MASPGLQGKAIYLDMETAQFDQAIKDLIQRTDVTQLRGVLRKTGTKVIVPALGANMTVNSTNLRKSFGNVTGKSKSVATVFVGPRMDHDHNARRTTPMGKINVVIAARYKGFLANIIENNKFRPRYPGLDYYGNQKPKPRVPGFGGYPHDVREHTGVFPAHPFIRKTAIRQLPKAIDFITKELRELITKK